MIKFGGIIIISVSFLLISADDDREGKTMEQYLDEEYVLDHRVSYNEALAEARKFTLPPGPIPGCQRCTHDEILYCKNGNVIQDHCCCDGAYNKVFPFVEHTCKVKRQACKVLANDCAEYTRLRKCCCHSYLGSVWKNIAGSGEEKRASYFIVLGSIPVHKLLQSIYN